MNPKLQNQILLTYLLLEIRILDQTHEIHKFRVDPILGLVPGLVQELVLEQHRGLKEIKALLVVSMKKMINGTMMKMMSLQDYLQPLPLLLLLEPLVHSQMKRVQLSTILEQGLQAEESQ